jgi:hypothetical protein
LSTGKLTIERVYVITSLDIYDAAPAPPSRIPDLALFSHALSSLRRSTAHGRSSLATARLNGLTSKRSSAQAAGPSVM